MIAGLKATLVLGVVSTFVFIGNLSTCCAEGQAAQVQIPASQSSIQEKSGQEWALGTPLGHGMVLPPELVTKAVATIQAKRTEKGITLAELSKLTGRSPVFIAAALRGQARLHPDAAQKVAKALELDAGTASMLTACPVRDEFPCTTDPLRYRLFEIIGVYGDAIRDACNELFGDGIMSAIAFKMNVDKEVIDGTDYVVITMKGKWLPYKEF